ncbi:phospholipase D-like domain-containing protein [Burkholderia sp. Ax-1719]|uniref:phospholipase D-like domain-containing protein n=1 Tax=Burkholderia sp. Ax-1719 TaxID=2608334 RepID=UPI00141DCE84|nr:phospholipase D-like domain-containing protein [Burkholderia sp. Ax-1719]NIE68007.1 phosphatidylserine/phosphatidylglycerophosphate/cardiolipin synthase family protein [Burkholderia sp. Ax-1719]
MATLTTKPITTPIALSCKPGARLTSPWFVQGTEYLPAPATYLPLVNGEAAFGAVFDAIRNAEHSIDILCWGFQPSMYFRRGGDASGAPSIGELLEYKGLERPDIKIRLLVWSDALHVSSFSEDMMPGNHGLFGLAGAAADGRTRAQREFDILWYKRASLTNVTRVSAGTKANPFPAARALVTVGLNALPGAPTPLKNIEFATRDFDLRERAEIAWRTWMGGPDGDRALRDLNTAAMTAEPSHHQKMVLVDYEAPEKAIGFVMGHNTLDEYWDRDDHTYLRQAPRMGRNGLHPRQDMSAKVTGPILDYLNRNFCQAWDDATGQNITAARAGLSRQLKLRPEHGKPVMAQILRTQSQHGKGGTKDISKLYVQAVNNATNFVYIENQYFRYMPVANKLRDNVNSQTSGGRNPAKHGVVYLFVVTNSNDDGIGLGTVSTYQMLDALGYVDRMPGVEKLEKSDQLAKQAQALTDQFADEQATSQRMMQHGADFSHMQGLANYAADSQLRQTDIQQQLNEVRQEQRRVANLSPDGMTKDEQLVPPQDMPGLKVLVCTLVAPDTPAGQPWDYVYIHQKLMIVDDVFTTHGSANVNRRSMEVDSELNICHEHGEVTRALRKQMWGLHTNGGGAQDDMSKAYKEWSRLISRNTKFQRRKQAPVASLVGFLRTSPSRSYLD